MTSIIRMFLLTILLLACMSSFVIATDFYPGPDNKKTVEASEEAVKRLGKDKGAILIDYKAVDIIGLGPIAISSNSIKIEETLKDLHAKIVGTEIQISLSGDVLFDFDKWDIRPEAQEPLYKIVKVIKELKKKNILIEGYTDSKGSDSYNLKLSQERADSVKAWFLEKGGLFQAQLLTQGYGESKPIEPNTNPDGSDNPEGRAKNRRVEIRIKK